jgi:DMSO/TMAO reductase YedYZ molybdopterin-dependent catalytic subunit
VTDANDRLIQAKQKLANERAARGLGTGSEHDSRERLPPGQKLVTDHWPVLDLGLHPEVSPAEWQLAITGAAVAATLTWDDFRAMPQTTLTTDLHCVTTWSIYDARVEGVLWADFVKAIRPDQDATHVMLHSHDGYTTNLPLAELERPDVALVHSFGGKPLTREHGGPVRMWVPHLYAWKSAKWLKGIEFMTEDRPGFWEVRGYHNLGDPWKEQRYS